MVKFEKLSILSGFIFISTILASQGSDVAEVAIKSIPHKDNKAEDYCKIMGNEKQSTPIQRDSFHPAKGRYSEEGVLQFSFKADRYKCSHLTSPKYHSEFAPWIREISFMYNPAGVYDPKGKRNKIRLSAFGIGDPIGLQYLKKAPYKDFILVEASSDHRHYCLSDDNRVDDYLAAFYDRDLIDDKVVETIKNFLVTIHHPFKEFRYTEVITKVVTDRTKERLAVQS